MRRTLALAAAALVGALAGAAGMAYLHAASAGAVLDMALREHRAEQSHLLGRAAREGDVLGQLVHATNLVHADSGVGFSWARRARTMPLEERVIEPFGALVLRRFFERESQSEQDLDKRRARHARLAVSLERAGFRELAQEQWQAAESLHDVPRERLRQMAECCMTPDHGSELGLAIESAFLDSETYAELTERLTGVREELRSK